jgi:hypothetical protein
VTIAVGIWNLYNYCNVGSGFCNGQNRPET